MARDDHENDISSNRPVDDVVAGLIETINNKGRGFVLGLSNEADGKTAIEVKESLPPHDEWQAPADYRAHKIDDTESFIAYAKRYGDEKGSLVFYSDLCAVLSIGEEVERGTREIVKMDFNESPDWKDWTAALTGHNHKNLLKFLMIHEHNLDEPEVLKSMQVMKLNSVVNLESDIRDDGQSVGIMVKTNQGDELKKFPKSFDITLPVLEQDQGDDSIFARAVIRLEVQLPDDPKSGPTFALFCSVWRQIKRGRIDAEGAKIREGLSGWTVVHGSHVTTPRRK